MGLSSKFKPGIVALVAVGFVQLATALPQIERYGDGSIYVADSENCEAVATALNSLKYGSSSITGVGCAPNRAACYLTAPGADKHCEAVATALNSLKFGSSSITGVECDDTYRGGGGGGAYS